MDIRFHFVVVGIMGSVALGFSAQAQAQSHTVAQWTFNSVIADNDAATGTLLPRIGQGSASLVGGVNSLFFDAALPADDLNASSDPALTDDSSWMVRGFAAQGTGDRANGVQFNVSTLGLRDVVVSYDFRPGRRSAAHHVFQVSADGVSFDDFASFEKRQAEEVCAWFPGVTVDLSSLTAVNDNPNFAFRIVSTFAPGTQEYSAARPSLTYADFANWRFDMVSVSAVPEPEVYALLLAGLGLVGAAARRRKSAR